MADIALIKKLRGMTHAPLKDCKSAITEADGDLEKAQEILKEKWALKAAKKADRETNEGTIAVIKANDKVVWVKLACETDFVAKNPTFVWLAKQIAEIFGETDTDFEGVDAIPSDLLEKANKLLKDNFVTIGENMQILDAFALSGNCYVYRHPGDKIAAVVFYDGDAEKAKNVALQAAAMNPLYLSVDNIPQDEVDEAKKKLAEDLQDSNKPDDIKEKIVEWRLNKQWSEIVLLKQPAIVDDSKTVEGMLWDTTVTKFIRFAI